MKDKKIKLLRDEIDNIDDQLIKLIIKRSLVVKKLEILKIPPKM